ncbi:MAG: Multi-sensor signal transduction histidine kinase [Holophagaceae bacterium]|nr:Multi-sensor signal transduction histidine kinase [Holophagaceae bacterium]
MRAGRAEAWQLDSAALLRLSPQAESGGRPGTIWGRLPESKPLVERKRLIEERFPYVAVLPEPQAPDDPVLLADQPAYLTLRKEFLDRLDRERNLTLWRVALEGAIFLGAILLGLGYFYRKLNSEMDLKLRQRNFIAAVTHELKTPLASVSVWVETLFTRQLDDAQKARIQHLLDGDLLRLNDLVGNLLRVAQMDAGSMEFSPSPRELGPWLEEVCTWASHRYDAGSLGLRMNLAPNVWAEIDPKALAIVMENLLSNAYKYASPPRETVVTLDAVDDWAIIVVADRGQGISSRDIHKLFQRFFRAGDEMTRAIPGTGLGLFLCKEIVAAHHGYIRAASLGQGLGSTFTLRLPRLAR